MDSDMETYAIIYATALEGLGFAEFRQDNAETCRRSVDGTKALVSWLGAMPTGLEPLTTHTDNEIIDVISGEEWTPVIEE